jgi:hypothetical protein
MEEKPNIIKVRIFGSKNCEECLKQTKSFDLYSIDYDFIDVDSDKNQKISDENNIDRIPHIQAYFLESKKVIFSKIGYISPIVFMDKLSSALSEKYPKNLLVKGVRQQGKYVVEPKNNGGGCTGCKNAKKNS